jgi:hypothetical protein
MPRTETQVILDALVQRLANLEKRSNEAHGRDRGLSDSWGYLVGALGLVIGIVGIIIAVRG